jgi:hypothetical protein
MVEIGESSMKSRTGDIRAYWKLVQTFVCQNKSNTGCPDIHQHQHALSV